MMFGLPLCKLHAAYAVCDNCLMDLSLVSQDLLYLLTMNSYSWKIGYWTLAGGSELCLAPAFANHWGG